MDYFLSTVENFSVLENFTIHEFSELYSDAHCPLSICVNVDLLEITCPNQANKIDAQEPKVIKWDATKRENFIENFDVMEAAAIETKLNELLHNSDITKSNINETVVSIGKLFNTCSKETFGEVANTNSYHYNKIKPWFNGECFQTRNLYHKCRRMYNKYKSNYYKNILKIVSKKYKTTLSKTQQMYKDKKINEIRKLKSTNPKKYWKTINTQNKKDEVQAPLEELYRYFKTSNEQATNIEETENDDFDLVNNEINDEINQPITENEILHAVRSLKTNKAPGLDGIVNEQIKSTISYMSPIYVKLFNIIFDSGIMPNAWTVGNIKPIYKNKGDPQKPENYRPITLVSSLGKTFTSIINNRLKTYAENYDLISWSQAGFRKHHSTTDNLFIIKCLIDIVRARKKKLFCCFIDFKQAFDTVWRKGLWYKMLESKINGKCFNIIYNLYQDIKSKITTKEGSSCLFNCTLGVWQGEILSPFLFCIFLNDLETFLHQNNVSPIRLNVNNEEIMIFLKLFLLLYADDTVLFSDNEIDMQQALSVFETYCKEWKLTVNTEKTKIVIFGQGRKTNAYHFTINMKEIEITKDYKYLGILFAQSGSLLTSKKHIAEQGSKAMFSLLRKIKCLQLPFDIQIDLFNKIVKPVLLYGSEIWGFGNLDILERVQLKFYKYIFNLKTSTPSAMIYGELGILPLRIDIQCRMISFWARINEDVEENERKLSPLIYKLVYNLQNTNNFKSQWIDSLKNLICSLGFGGIWYSQSFTNKNWFVKACNQKLKDIFTQEWFALIEASSSSNIYKIIKTKFEQSTYISKLSPYHTKTLLSFRTRNHRLPVEVGRWRGIAVHERLCTYCNDDIGDEFHFLLVCKQFHESRTKFIKSYYYRHPNILKFEQLMNVTNLRELKRLCIFINLIMKNVNAV